jgi:hypothetical protein
MASVAILVKPVQMVTQTSASVATHCLRWVMVFPSYSWASVSVNALPLVSITKKQSIVTSATPHV